MLRMPAPTSLNTLTPSTPWAVTTPRYSVTVRPSIPGVVVMSIAVLLQGSWRSVGTSAEARWAGDDGQSPTIGHGGLWEPVDPCRDDEVVAGQAPDGVGPERNEDLPPGHGQLRVMERAFGEQRDPGGESERIPEVVEGEFPAELTGAVSLPALVQVGGQRFGFVLAQWRGALRVLDGLLLMQRHFPGHRSSSAVGSAT